MDELLVKINYLIREKLWCSIRTLCDNVSTLPMLILKIVAGIGARKGCRPSSCFLEGIRNLQRRQRQ